ncbi:hypothetical protein VT03_15310 [Planctomyces sp. SH-PL14]|nr:hypothetical protein VT03_15310 [Planctomyces sp. SH-PL14]
MLCEMIQGQAVFDLQKLDEQRVIQEIGIPLSPVRRNCALLAHRALLSLLASLREGSTSNDAQ